MSSSSESHGTHDLNAGPSSVSGVTRERLEEMLAGCKEANRIGIDHWKYKNDILSFGTMSQIITLALDALARRSTDEAGVRVKDEARELAERIWMDQEDVRRETALTDAWARVTEISADQIIEFARRLSALSPSPTIQGEAAMQAARDWISQVDHDERCFTNDPNPDACRCICGKDSLLTMIDDAAIAGMDADSPAPEQQEVSTATEKMLSAIAFALNHPGNELTPVTKKDLRLAWIAGRASQWSFDPPPSPAPEQQEVSEAIIDAVMEVERYAPKTIPMGANPPLFNGMQPDNDGPWVSRVAVAKRLRAALATGGTV